MNFTSSIHLSIFLTATVSLSHSSQGQRRGIACKRGQSIAGHTKWLWRVNTEDFSTHLWNLLDTERILENKISTYSMRFFMCQCTDFFMTTTIFLQLLEMDNIGLPEKKAALKETDGKIIFVPRGLTPHPIRKCYTDIQRKIWRFSTINYLLFIRSQ